MITDKLMSGNWLYSELNKQNFCATPEDVFNISQNNSCASGIPLTPDILGKAGFEGNNTKDIGNGWFIGWELDCVYIQFEKKKQFDYVCEMMYFYECKYLHQLQNVYPFFFGKELEIVL